MACHAWIHRPAWVSGGYLESTFGASALKLNQLDNHYNTFSTISERKKFPDSNSELFSACGEPTVTMTISEVEDQTDQQPDQKSGPVSPAELCHQIATSSQPKHRNERM